MEIKLRIHGIHTSFNEIETIKAKNENKQSKKHVIVLWHFSRLVVIFLCNMVQEMYTRKTKIQVFSSLYSLPFTHKRQFS